MCGTGSYKLLLPFFRASFLAALHVYGMKYHSGADGCQLARHCYCSRGTEYMQVVSSATHDVSLAG